MPKLKPISGETACRLLAQQGFKEVRPKGSHIIMQKRDGNGTITVPIPNRDQLRVGTLRSIIRQSGLPHTVFEA